jgi:hypothetical protein
MRRETSRHGANVQTPYCVGWRVMLPTRRKPLCFSQGYLTWDRTNIVNRIGILGWPSNYITMGITYEYLLDFRRLD